MSEVATIAVPRRIDEALKWRLEVSTNLDVVETTWRNFEAAAEGTVFQQFDWQAEWHRHIGINTTPVVVLVWFGDQLKLLLPLAIERYWGGHRLIWSGKGVSDYNVPLIAPNFSCSQFPQLWQQIVHAIAAKHRFDIIEFHYMLETIGTQANPFLGLPIAYMAMDAHAATLSDDWLTFYNSKISTRTQHTDRRKMRHLAKIGDICFCEVKDQRLVDDTVTTLIQQKRDSYARMGVVDMFDNQGFQDFYHAVASNSNLRDIVHITRLDVGNIPAATGLGLCFRGIYHLIMSSYQSEIAKHSPGRAHIHELLRHAIAHRMHTFDFTIGDEDYKLHWSDIHPHLFSYVNGYTLRGHVMVRIQLLLDAANRWYSTHGVALKHLVQRIRRSMDAKHRRKA